MFNANLPIEHDFKPYKLDSYFLKLLYLQRNAFGGGKSQNLSAIKGQNKRNMGASFISEIEGLDSHSFHLGRVVAWSLTAEALCFSVIQQSAVSFYTTH